jgi:very-short-patch-repair endonuclease
MKKRRQSLPSGQKSKARDLRQEGTIPERLLWGRLRNGRLLGLKFRRQEPVGDFIVDFVCRPRMIAIEVDGNSHIESAEYDRRRATAIESTGFRILRVGNDDVVQDIDSVLSAIILACGLDPESSARTARRAGDEKNA